MFVTQNANNISVSGQRWREYFGGNNAQTKRGPTTIQAINVINKLHRSH